jgi:DNA-directed RNA polymerase subunit beta'
MPFYNCALGKKRSLNKVIDDCHKILGRRSRSRCSTISSRSASAPPLRAGLSFGKDDMRIPSKKKEILGRRRSEVDRVEKNYEQGVITERERYNQLIDIWTHCRERTGWATETAGRRLRPTSTGEGVPYLNPIYLHGDSGREATSSR